MSTQKTIESKAPKYVDDDSGSHYSNEFEEVLEVEKLIQQDFDFDAPSKPTPFREARFLSSTVEVTGLWIEKVPHENKELILKLQVPDDETRYLQLDWQKESQKIESIFKSFGVSSDNAADIVGEKTHINISTETNRARFSNVIRLSFDEMALVFGMFITGLFSTYVVISSIFGITSQQGLVSGIGDLVVMALFAVFGLSIGFLTAIDAFRALKCIFDRKIERHKSHTCRLSQEIRRD